MKKSILISIILCSSIFAIAQEEVTATTDLRKDALNVYMDANDYIRKEIPFVNYVRDIKVADVYIIASSQGTGSGGRETTYFINGQNKYEGMNDTLAFVTTSDVTQEEFRKQQVKTLKMGLIRYIAKTPIAKYIEIKFTEPIEEEVSIDKWNSWVFRTRLNGYMQGQKSYKSTNINGSFEVNKITPDWKTRMRISYGHNSSKFKIDDETITSINNSKSIYGLLVKSIGEHWSIGGSTRIGTSTYSNMNLYANILPGIEYDIFPYSESTRKQLRILYSLGAYIYNYTDTTIYNKTQETHLGHQLSIAYESVQKWGSIEIDMTWKNYFVDWKKNNLSLQGYINLRVAKGLTFNVGGHYQLVHDQLNLVKGGASSEEILLRQKELESNYNFFLHFGFTFTFGSIYNNVVNPRFDN